MDDVKDDPDENENANVTRVTHLISHLEPFTQYAYYVKTYTLSSVSMGAISPIQYFRTAPGEPSIVQRLKHYSNESSVIFLTWDAPKKANGNLTTYIIKAKIHADNKKQILSRNYCTERKIS